MTKLSEREIARRLAGRATPEPPPGLADRIKADIPASLRLDRQAVRPERRWLMPPPVEGLHPSWLAAACVLLVLGMGMVAAHIPVQPDDVWKWMALSGVVHIDDIVVTAPAPSRSPGTAVAMAPPQAAKGLRVPVPARRTFVPATRGGESAAAAADAVASEPAPPAAAPEPRASEEAAGMSVAPPPPAVPATDAPSPVRARGAVARDANTVIVAVLDEAGRPCEGVTVTLERVGGGASRTWTARTDSGGRATFRGVPPASYRALAAAPAIVPAQVVVTVASERAGARAELRVRTRPRR
jgi:Carboxypeptidase regulatory-like domain